MHCNCEHDADESDEKENPDREWDFCNLHNISTEQMNFSTMMNSSDLQALTSCNNINQDVIEDPCTKHSQHLSAVLSLHVEELQQPRDNNLEPTPFREGAFLQLLPGSDNIFVTVTAENNSMESYVSSAVACISSRRQPSEIMELASSVNHDTILNLLPSLPAVIGDAMPQGNVPDGEEEESSTSSSAQRVQKLQNSHDDSWEERFQELLQFKVRHGHCLVPHAYPENPPFARWAKRQRFQYKLLRDHKPSVMTEERVHKLESVGFVWDPQGNAWETQLMELIDFKTVHGHCNVPCRYPQNPRLGAWVKRQRRQYKKYMSGEPTNTPPERFQILTDLGFQWEIATPRLKKGN